jgi:hypothetical protein
VDVGLADYFVDFGRQLHSAAGDLESVLGEELERFADRAIHSAVSWSSGGFSSAQLAAMGHPYAKRAPHPPQDPGIINRQSGTFLRSWRSSGLEYTLEGLGIRVFNEAPYADYLDKGTSLMILRPIIDRLDEELLPELISRLESRLATFWGQRVNAYSGAITLLVGDQPRQVY